LVVVAGLLSLVYFLAPAIGAFLSFAVGLLAVFCGLLALFLFATTVLDADVVQAAGVGGVLGIALDAIDGIAWDELGFLRGVVAGAIIGDMVRQTVAGKLGPPRFSAHRSSKWFWPASMLMFASSLILVVVYQFTWATLPQSNSVLIEFLTAMREQRDSLGVGEMLRRGWAETLLLGISGMSAARLFGKLATTNFTPTAKLAPTTQPLVIMQRVAICHALLLLLFAGRGMFAIGISVWNDESVIEPFALWTVELQMPLIFLVATMCLTSKSLGVYLWRFGWLPLLGFSCVVGVIWTGLFICQAIA